MAEQRKKNLDEVKNWLNRLELSIKSDVALRHQDSLIELETFFRDLLNLIYGWNLVDANTLLGNNQDSYDLSDESVGVAAQVTVTTSSAKIRKTLKSFIGNHDKKFTRLVFFYPRAEYPSSKADFSVDLNGFDFVASRDRISFNNILVEAQGFNIDRQASLVEFLRRELEPLGKALPECSSICGEVVKNDYSKWVREASSTYFVPGLNLVMPIEDTWIRLSVMEDDKSIIGEKSSLDAQFQNYLEFGQRLRGNGNNKSVSADLLPLTQSRTILVGGPGDGKSTMLRRFAWNLSSDSTIVVRVRLPLVLQHMLNGRSFVESLILVGFDGSGISLEDQAKLLNSANYLLCDGLDECDPHRTKVAEKIAEWGISHRSCSIVVSTRPVGHATVLLPNFTHFGIQPPEDRDVNDLSRKLFSRASGGDNAEKCEAFLNTINSWNRVPHVRNLASRNPLLLGFLIQLFLSDVELDAKRSELYTRIFELMAKTEPNDRDSVNINKRVAIDVVNALAWKQTTDPFNRSDETTEFVSNHIQRKYNLDVLKADKLTEDALLFWRAQRLIETLTVGAESRIFFLHLSLQEYAAARYAKNLGLEKFSNWITRVRRQPSWKQVILLLASIEENGRTISSLLRLDEPNDPVSVEALLAVDGCFERSVSGFSVEKPLIDALSARFLSNIPLVSVEASLKLALLAPYAKLEISKIAEQELSSKPWAALGSLLLRIIINDDNEIVEEFKLWFSDFKPIYTHLSMFGSRDDFQLLPEEAGELQREIVDNGLDLVIATGEPDAIANYFKDISELRILSVYQNQKTRERLIGIGLPETAALFNDRLSSSAFSHIEEDSLWWREWNTYLLELVVKAVDANRPAENAPPYSSLSMLISGLGYWEASVDYGATNVLVGAENDRAGCEVVRALSMALKLDVTKLGAEAQAALDWCSENNVDMHRLIEKADIQPDWSTINLSEINADLLASGLLHPMSFISKTATRALESGIEVTDARGLITEALESKLEHVILHAAVIADNCLGHQVFEVLNARLNSPILPAHRLIFRQLAYHSGVERRQDTISCIMSWLEVENPVLATGIAESLTDFEPPLDETVIVDLRRLFVHWTERGPSCDRHGRIEKGSCCSECSVVPSSPRATLLGELSRLNAVDLEELFLLCDDERHDVSKLSKSIIVERCAKEPDVFSEVLDRIKSCALSPRLLDSLLKLPIEQGGAIADQVERILHSSDLRLRLATIGQLTGTWIERQRAVEYLRNAIHDSEPAVRTLATRILRLLE